MFSRSGPILPRTTKTRQPKCRLGPNRIAGNQMAHVGAKKRVEMSLDPAGMSACATACRKRVHKSVNAARMSARATDLAGRLARAEYPKQDHRLMTKDRSMANIPIHPTIYAV